MSSATTKDDLAEIIIKKQPNHVFYDKEFEVCLRLRMPAYSASKSSTFESIKICAVLCHESQGKASPVPVELNDDNQLITEDGSMNLSLKKKDGEDFCITPKFRIKSHIASDKPTSFCIKFCESPNCLIPEIIPNFFSRSIQLVNAEFQILVQTKNWDEVWYKDEGGRDKCMQVNVRLCDGNGRAVKQQTYLKLTLVYDNDQFSPVMNQDILKTFGLPRQSTSVDGKAKIQFRIEDVSKNHQRQKFAIKVSSDPSSSVDIAPAVTPSVDVKSKRNKKRPLLSTSTPLPHAQGSHHRMSHVPEISLPLGGVSDVSRLREAMKGVIEWTEQVVHGLHPLKWQLLGYRQLPNGNVDYNRPYHGMPDPNDCISRILTTYNEKTSDSLRIVRNAVENTVSSHEQHRLSPFHVAQGGGPIASSHQMEQMYEHDKPSSILQGIPHQVANSLPSMMYGEEKPVSTSPPPTQHSSHHNRTRMDEMMLPKINPMPYEATIKPVQGSYGYTPQESTIEFRTNTPEKVRQTARHQYVQGMNHAMQMNSDQQRADSDLDRMHDKQAEEELDGESRQADVQYVLAKQFKSLHTRELLGFPAYSRGKKLLGFFRESSMKLGVGRFVPFAKFRKSFVEADLFKASEFLSNALQKGDKALFVLDNFTSISNMINAALVYDWQQKICKGESSNSSGDSHILPVDTSPESFS